MWQLFKCAGWSGPEKARPHSLQSNKESRIFFYTPQTGFFGNRDIPDSTLDSCKSILLFLRVLLLRGTLSGIPGQRAEGDWVLRISIHLLPCCLLEGSDHVSEGRQESSGEGSHYSSSLIPVLGVPRGRATSCWLHRSPSSPLQLGLDPFPIYFLLGIVW